MNANPRAPRDAWTVSVPMEVFNVKIKLLVILCLAAVLIALAVLVLRSATQYEIMSKREQLKAQLMEEYHMRTKDLFKQVEVERPWYSRSPSKWTFVVTFADDRVVYYRYVKGDRVFVEIQP